MQVETRPDNMLTSQTTSFPFRLVKKNKTKNKQKPLVYFENVMQMQV